MDPTQPASSVLIAAAQNLVAVFTGLSPSVIETIPGAIADGIRQLAKALVSAEAAAPASAPVAEAPAVVLPEPAPATDPVVMPTADIRIGRGLCEIRLNGETDPSETLVNREAQSAEDAHLFGRVAELQATHTVTVTDL